MINQKNFNAIYLAGQTVNFKINYGNFTVNLQDMGIKTYTPSRNSSKEFSALQIEVLDKSGIHDSLKLAIFLLVPLLGFLLVLIICYIKRLLRLVPASDEFADSILSFIILFCLPFLICLILSIIFYFYNYAYFKKMSQLFDIVKETDFKEENLELFNQLNFIYNFQYILLAFILIIILLYIIMGFIIKHYDFQEFHFKIIFAIFLFKIPFAIFLLIAYFKQKNKITINAKEEEKIKQEEIEQDEEIEI